MNALFARFGAWIVGIGGAALGILAIFASAKKSGAAEGEKVAAQTIQKDREAIAADTVKRSDAAANVQAETIARAKDATDEVNRTDVDVLRSELRDKWTRD